MNVFNYVKNMTVDELAAFIVKKAMMIEAARNEIRLSGGDTDRWLVWVDVMKKKLLEELK